MLKHLIQNRFCAVCLALLLGGSLRAGDLRVSTPEAMKAAVKKAQPEYPPTARQLRVSGKVEVDVVIDQEGNVADVKILSGNALLTNAVVSAVKKWKFTPFTSNGEAAKAIALLDFEFKM